MVVMRVSTFSVSEAIVLRWVVAELLPQIKEFEYLEVFLVSENKINISRWVCVASAVMWVLYLTVMVRREMNWY